MRSGSPLAPDRRLTSDSRLALQQRGRAQAQERYRFMASTKAGTARSRGRLGFAALAAVAAPLLLACGPMPGEEPTAQFPSNQPIGAEGFPSSDQGTFADVNGIPYGNRNGGGWKQVGPIIETPAKPGDPPVQSGYFIADFSIADLMRPKA